MCATTVRGCALLRWMSLLLLLLLLLLRRLSPTSLMIELSLSLADTKEVPTLASGYPRGEKTLLGSLHRLSLIHI